VLVAALSLFAQQDDSLADHAAAAAQAMQAGDYAAAERHNRAIVKLQPQLAEARINLGLSCYLQKKYDEAIRQFELGLKTKPELTNAWLLLGLSRFQSDRPAEAVTALKRYSTERPKDFQGVYFLGLSYLALENYAEAEKSLTAARQLDPRSVDVLYHLAQVYLGRARKEPASAEPMRLAYEKCVQEIAAIDPKSFRIAQMRAGSYEAIGKKTEAIAELENLLARDPKVRGLHYTLGCLYLEGVQYDKAVEQFQLELQLDAPFPRTYLQLGHAYLKLNRPEDAVSFLEKAAALEKDQGTVWVEIGRAYRSLNQFDKSADAFQKAIQSGERSSSVYYQLAVVARRAGKLELAQRAMRESEILRKTEPPTMRAPLQ
jgi:tetratricopeptide (TPR) repeat protein